MILISGATGNVGSELLRLLPEARPLVRDAARAPAGHEPVIGDLTSPDAIPFDGVDALYLMPGSPGVAEAAAAAGVARIVLLSGSSAEGGHRTDALSRYMIDSEESVRAAGPEWTILRPSSFMVNALRWLPQVKAGGRVEMQFPSVAVAVIDPADIAAMAAAALTEPGHVGETYRITGPEALLPADQVRIMGEVLGREVTAVGLSDEDTRRQMEAMLPKPYADAFYSFFAEGKLDESIVTSAVPDVLGRPARTFREWAQSHL